MTRVALTIALIATLAACAGDDAAVTYLEAVSSSNRQMEAETFAALPRGEVPTRDGVAGVVAARKAGVDRLRELSPPARFRVEHDALVITLEVLIDETRRIVDRASHLSDEEFVAEMVSAVQLDVLAEAVGRACRALQAAASQSGHEVDLTC